jgi:hypothetical protein
MKTPTFASETIKDTSFNELLQNDVINPDKGGEITLFYGTNRIGKPKKFVNDRYGAEGDKLLHGIWTVSIPPGHKAGEMERPGTVLWLFRRNEYKGEHIMLQCIEEKTQTNSFSF